MIEAREDQTFLQPDLRGQVALVTGGGRGLGRAFAHSLAAAGAAVAIVARSVKQLDDTVASITAAGGRAISIETDVTKPDAVGRMASAVEQQLGPVDILINNAAITTPVGPSWEVDADAWWQCIESNLRGPFLCSRAILPRMIERRRGRIINVGSTGGLRVIPSYSAYGTSKAALVRFTETLAAETKPYGLGVFAIHPGLVRTAMTEYLAESSEGQEWLPWVREVLAAGRDNSSTGAVRLILFLASGRGDSLTGRFLNVADDIAQLVKRRVEIEQGDWYTMRLRVPPA